MVLLDEPLIQPASLAAIAMAGALLRAGRLVAFPTETVYGLGADATSDEAVARIFSAKDRPSFNPLIVHFAMLADAEREAIFDNRARRLADAFWPGALTLVLPRRPENRISLLCSAGLDSLALRVPAQLTAQRLLESLGGPIAAPSANASGRISPTSAAHVQASLAGRVDLILDDGPCAIGLESTVLDLTGEEPRLLRPGGVTREALEAVVGPLAAGPLAAGPLAAAADDRVPRGPGQLESHYAPALPLRRDAATVASDEALLAFGPAAPKGAMTTINLSASGDLTEAAGRLFAALHELDRSGAQAIAVMPVPEEGLGRAINDRLRRAAAPRPRAADAGQALPPERPEQ